MKTQTLKMENGGWQTHSVLECGRAGSPLPAARWHSDGAHGVTRPTLICRLALLFCFFILQFSFCLRASGQTYSIDWHKISGAARAATEIIPSAEPSASRTRPCNQCPVAIIL
jgi:hypothetical protein